MIALARIRAAAERLAGSIHRTPLLSASGLGARAGAALYLKCENLQKTGSFKPRGALNKVMSLSPGERARGLVTVSAGNHAQAVAWAARIAGAACTVVMPTAAPASKIEATRGYGAEIVLHEDRATLFDKLAEVRDARGLSFVHPFDDPETVAGAGTTGLEILEDLPEVDAVVAALGGGGLLSGIGSVMRARKPSVRVYAAEPETAAPLELSLRRGEASRFEGWTPSFVDGAGGKSVLPTMWPLLKELVDGSIVMPLDAIAAAMRKTAERVHVVAEGAGGTAIAAALSGRAGTGKIVAVVSGGNIDLSRFSELVNAHTHV